MFRLIVISLALLAFSGPAVAQRGDYSTNAARNSALGQAGRFAEAASNNIGIVIYYGSRNEASPQQAGDYVVSLLQERFRYRKANDPSFTLKPLNVRYFIQDDPDGSPGISVGYMIGRQGVSAEIRKAVTPIFLDEVLDKRWASAQLAR